MNIRGWLFILLLFTNCFLFSDVTEDFLLDKIGESRGPSGDFVSSLKIINIVDEKVTDENLMQIFVSKTKDDENRTIAYFLEPASEKGRKMLLVGTDTWLYIPGTKRPIKISLSQKLSGGVSTGDILSIGLKSDYTATILGEEKRNDIDCYKLNLIAKNNKVTYYKVIFYISKRDFKPVQAEYYSQTDKLLKKGYFRKYQNNLCVEILIEDKIQSNRVSVIKYLKFESKKINELYFNPNTLKDFEL